MPPPPRTNSRGGSGEVKISRFFRQKLELRFFGKSLKFKFQSAASGSTEESVVDSGELLSS